MADKNGLWEEELELGKHYKFYFSYRTDDFLQGKVLSINYDIVVIDETRNGATLVNMEKVRCVTKG